MAEVLCLHGLGAVVEVRCTGRAAAAFATAMRVAWSRCLEAPGGLSEDAPAAPVPASPVDVRLDDETELAPRLMMTTQRVTQSLIGAQIGRLLMFHAGAVADLSTGRALVYVAPGGTGKTTLSRLLGRRLGYLTDETVGIDENGVILPYPKPLSVRRRENHGLKDEVSPDALNLLPAPPTPHVAGVVLLDRSTNGRGTSVEAMGFMDALFALTAQSSSLPALSRPLHRLAELIDTSGPVLRVRYTEATDLEKDVTALMGRVP